MSFGYKTKKEDQAIVVELDGTLNDKSQAQPLLDEVEEFVLNGSVKFIISMKEFKYINSTGLNVLINILTKARKAGGEVMIANVPEKINELLLITKLNTVFTVTGSVPDALKLLK